MKLLASGILGTLLVVFPLKFPLVIPSSLPALLPRIPATVLLLLHFVI